MYESCVGTCAYSHCFDVCFRLMVVRYDINFCHSLGSRTFAKEFLRVQECVFDGTNTQSMSSLATVFLAPFVYIFFFRPSIHFFFGGNIFCHLCDIMSGSVLVRVRNAPTTVWFGDKTFVIIGPLSYLVHCQNTICAHIHPSLLRIFWCDVLKCFFRCAARRQLNT